MSDKEPQRHLKSEIHDIIRTLEMAAHQKQELHIRTEQYEGDDLEKLFTEVTEKSQTPREQSEAISEGEAEEHHIGKHTPEILQQELFSLMNTKPAFRDMNWQKKWERISHLIEDIKDVRVKRRLKQKAKDMLGGEQ